MLSELRELKNGGLPLVSVCVLTYRRIELLERTVAKFLEGCGYPRNRLELILCDDGSPKAAQEIMTKMPFDVFVMSNKNYGLGRNANNGLKAASGDFILQLQDDWELIPGMSPIRRALDVFGSFPSVGCVRLTPVPRDISRENLVIRGGQEIWILRDVPASNRVSNDYACYSDQPHLKRKSFHAQLGYYLEGVPMTVTEHDFVERVANQSTVSVASLAGENFFNHTGYAVSFNPAVRKGRIKEKLNRFLVTRCLLGLYLKIKKFIV